MRIRQITLTPIGLALLIGLAACGPAPTPLPAIEPPIRLSVLRVELSEDERNIATLPWELAVRDLGEMGYTIEKLAYEDSGLAVAALDQGDVDVIASSPESAWSAIAQGAEIVSVLERANNSAIVLARTNIQTCEDLDGQPVGAGSVSGGSASMFLRYIELNCPDIEPEILVIANANNRRAALIAGEVSAVLLRVDDVLVLEDDAPGQFHTLVTFAEEFPGLTNTSFIVHRDTARDYPDTVKDVIRAMLLQRRRLQDPEVLAGELVGYLEVDEELAGRMADLFLANNIWAVNGDYDREAVQTNLEFVKAGGGVPADLTPEDVADWSFLEAVLGEIGRE